MDRGIYRAGVINPIGDHLARRLPRGSGDSVAAVPGGGTPLTSNPLPITLNFFQSALAPHGYTQRWIYTVPAKRRAKLETAFAHITRGAGAGAVGDTVAYIFVRRKGVTQAGPAGLVGELNYVGFVARAQFANVAVGASHQSINPGPVELFEGDILECTTVDVSTGGSVDYFATAILTEFDAVDSAAAARIVSSGAGGSAGSAGSGSSVSGGSALWGIYSGTPNPYSPYNRF